MPAIWNLNNNYNLNNRKVSSKLTFEVGEKFSGRIIGNGENGEVVVKLGDGWQFSAEIDGEFNPKEQVGLQFEVEGFDGGKLKLKIIKKEAGSPNQSYDSLGDVLEREGLPKEDISLLRSMVKHNMPLTRENITFIKGIIQFNEKINCNPEEVNEFIDKFVAGKDISPTSQEGKNIRSMLTDFFKSFKSMSSDDILFFLENDIDITKDNIEGYNKLFKSETTVKEYFDNVGENLKRLDIDISDPKKCELKPKNIAMDENTPNMKEIVNGENKNSNTTNSLASKIYDSNDVSKGRVSMLSLLKSMLGNDNNIMKEPIKEIFLVREDQFTTSEFKNVTQIINNISDEEFIELVRGNLGEDEVITKESVDKTLSNILNKEIELTDEEFKKLKDILEFKNKDLVPQDKDLVPQDKEIKVVNEEKTLALREDTIEVVNKEKTLGLKEDTIQNILKDETVKTASKKDIIRDDIKVKIEDIKEVVKELLAHSKNNGEGMEKVMDFLKGHMSEFKLLNSISNEYYYLDVPIKQNEQEYPCKLIIKDNRKDGKKIDTTNVKVVISVKTLNLGSIDGYLSIREKVLDVDIKCEEMFVKALDIGKSKLSKELQALGFITNVLVSKKSEEVSLTSCREFFNGSNTKAIDIKV